jgi:hypothetical protein
VGPRRRLRLHPAGVQVQARDAVRQGHAASAGVVLGVSGVVEEEAG